MTNFEYYGEDIKANGYRFGLVDKKIVKCSERYSTESCDRCEFNNYFSCGLRSIEWLFEEHVEQPKLTKEEYGFLLFLATGYYIARDADETLVVYSEKPKKDGFRVWESDYPTIDESICIAGNAFSFITWEDEEPWSVEDLLKLEVME